MSTSWRQREPRDRMVSAGEVSLRVLEYAGRGTPIVLLHPNRTNAHVWDHVVEVLERPEPVIQVEHRGHGHSDWPAKGYALTDYVNDEIALLEQLYAPVTLVGAATGGTVALLLASERPDLVSALAVVDPGLSLDPVIGARVRKEIEEASSFASRQEAEASLPFADLWADDVREHYLDRSLRELPDGRLAWRYHPAAALETETGLEVDLWSQIDVGAPTIIVRGALSAVFDRDRMLRLAQIIERAILVEVPRADHRVPQDNPVFLARVLEGWLDTLERA